jgi:hypothetical protein
VSVEIGDIGRRDASVVRRNSEQLWKRSA